MDEIALATGAGARQKPPAAKAGETIPAASTSALQYLKLYK
jgi:hypothetical protein